MALIQRNIPEGAVHEDTSSASGISRIDGARPKPSATYARKSAGHREGGAGPALVKKSGNEDSVSGISGKSEELLRIFSRKGAYLDLDCRALSGGRLRTGEYGAELTIPNSADGRSIAIMPVSGVLMDYPLSQRDRKILSIVQHDPDPGPWSVWNAHVRIAATGQSPWMSQEESFSEIRKVEATRSLFKFHLISAFVKNALVGLSSDTSSTKVNISGKTIDLSDFLSTEMQDISRGVIQDFANKASVRNDEMNERLDLLSQLMVRTGMEGCQAQGEIGLVLDRGKFVSDHLMHWSAGAGHRDQALSESINERMEKIAEFVREGLSQSRSWAMSVDAMLLGWQGAYPAARDEVRIMEWALDGIAVLSRRLEKILRDGPAMDPETGAEADAEKETRAILQAMNLLLPSMDRVMKDCRKGLLIKPADPGFSGSQVRNMGSWFDGGIDPVLSERFTNYLSRKKA